MIPQNKFLQELLLINSKTFPARLTKPTEINTERVAIASNTKPKKMPCILQSLELKEALSPMIMASKRFTSSMSKKKRSREERPLAAAEVATVTAVPAIMTIRLIKTDLASKEEEVEATVKTSARRMPISTTITAKSNQLNSIINSTKKEEEAVDRHINNARIINNMTMTINTRMNNNTTKSKEEEEATKETTVVKKENTIRVKGPNRLMRSKRQSLRKRREAQSMRVAATVLKLLGLMLLGKRRRQLMRHLVLKLFNNNSNFNNKLRSPLVVKLSAGELAQRSSPRTPLPFLYKTPDEQTFKTYHTYHLL